MTNASRQRENRAAVESTVPKLPVRAGGAKRPLCLLVAVLLLAWAPPGRAEAGARADARLAALPERETKLGTGAWCWFGDPRAVYHEGRFKRTYAAWVDRGGYAQIASRDRMSTSFSAPVKLQKIGANDHNNPSLFVRPDGHLIVFFSGHSEQRMYYRVSAAPEDISTWGPTQTVGTNTRGGHGYTYPNPVRLSAEPNNLFLFFRGGDWNPTVSTSDGGQKWTRARTVVRGPRGERPYMKVASNGRDTAGLAFTEAHPGRMRTSIYYAAYRGGSLRRADGRTIAPLGRPIRPSQADVVYRSRPGRPRAWIHDVALAEGDRPVLVYATFPSTRRHVYRYARWTGSRWQNQDIVSAGGSIATPPREPHYSGGISLDHEDPSVVYLSRRGSRGVHEVERWQTPDGGRTWTSQAITTASSEGNYRPVSPRGLPSTAFEVLWLRGNYGYFRTFSTSLVSRLDLLMARP